ncbi:hypothetical protein FB451DRAFT_1450353 [Mycena latifolia]|nr:hypothetical protein FB451DRAFT_1450353 [Mycena latifolia]
MLEWEYNLYRVGRCRYQWRRDIRERRTDEVTVKTSAAQYRAAWRSGFSRALDEFLKSPQNRSTRVGPFAIGTRHLAVYEISDLGARDPVGKSAAKIAQGHHDGFSRRLANPDTHHTSMTIPLIEPQRGWRRAIRKRRGARKLNRYLAADLCCRICPKPELGTESPAGFADLAACPLELDACSLASDACHSLALEVSLEFRVYCAYEFVQSGNISWFNSDWGSEPEEGTRIKNVNATYARGGVRFARGHSRLIRRRLHGPDIAIRYEVVPGEESEYEHQWRRAIIARGVAPFYLNADLGSTNGGRALRAGPFTGLLKGIGGARGWLILKVENGRVKNRTRKESPDLRLTAKGAQGGLDDREPVRGILQDRYRGSGLYAERVPGPSKVEGFSLPGPAVTVGLGSRRQHADVDSFASSLASLDSLMQGQRSGISNPPLNHRRRRRRKNESWKQNASEAGVCRAHVPLFRVEVDVKVEIQFHCVFP